MESREKKLAFFETACVVFWILLDGFWLMQWEFVTYLASALAIATAIPIFFYLEKKVIAYLVCCADSCWLIMNILWAMGDFPDPDIEWCLTASKILFGVAILFFIIAFFVSETKRVVLNLLLRRLRILRLVRTNK